MPLNRVTLKYKPDDVKLTVVLEDYRNAINALVDDANIIPTPVNLTPYVKADGTVPFTAVIAGITPTLDAHLSTKLYADDAIAAAIAAHAGAMGVAYTASTIENTTQVMANVTGISFPVLANTVYAFEAWMKVYTSAATNGIWYQFTGPASPTLVWAVFEYQTTAGVITWEQVAAFSAATAATGQITGIPMCRINGIISNGANAGTVQLQFRNEVASQTCRVVAGSTLVWYKLN